MAGRHEQLTDLFSRAIELDPAARAAFIAEVAREDGALALELASLLAADRGDVGAWRTGGLAPRGTKPPPLSKLTGAEFPGFRVAGVLGEGAMGVVLAAEQLSPRRPVAIKVLRARDPAVIARFTAEAEIMARLDHPGLARVLAAGDSAGAPYLVMERVDGVTLDEHVRATRPPLRARLALFAQVCDAVHHAHVKSVVHRDLKPSNIMVRTDGRVAVLDFGIARLVDGRISRTRAGELIGTPVYMSPEQARLRPDEVDTRSDVYTLGVILYELVSGALPYDVRERTVQEIVQTICEAPPVPLSQRDRALGGDLEAVVARALGKAPDARYPSAAALGDDVRRLLDGRPVSARAPGALELVGRWARRRPAAAAAATAAGLATIAAVATITALWLDARAARRAAIASRDDLEVRANELTLSRAQLALATDPAGALADLATLSPRGVDPWQAELVAAHARGLGSAERVLRGHRAETRWVERDATTQLVYTASYDGAVLAWPPTSEPAAAPRTLWRARGRAHVARPSPDGRYVAIGADAGEAAVVRVADGAVTPLAGHAHDVERLVWTPDARWLVTADDHGGARLWWDGGAGGVALTGPAAGVQALGACDDSTCAYAGDDHGGLSIWPLRRDGAAIAPRLHLDAGPAAVLGAWAGADRAAAATEDGAVTTWTLAGDPGAPPRASTVRTGAPIHDAAFGPHADFAVLGRTDGGVLLVEGERVTELGRLVNLVRTVAVSPDGAWIAAGTDGGELAVWNRATGRHLALHGHGTRLRHVVFDALGLLTSDGEGTVRAWRPAAIPPSVWLGRGVPIDHVRATGDGALVAIDTGGRITALAPDGGARALGEHGHRVHAALALPGELVTASGAEVAMWPLAGGAPVRVRFATGVSSLAASPDGARVAVATDGGPIELLDRGGAIVGELPGDDGGTDVVAWHPGGALLASGGEDRVIRLWRVDGGAPALVAALPGPTGDTHVLAFDPRGDRLIAGSDDGGVRVWTLRDGVPVGPARLAVRHVGAVLAVAVTPTSRVLVTAGRDGRLHRVGLDGGEIATRAIDTTPVALAAGDDAVFASDAAGALWRWAEGGTTPHPIPTDATDVLVDGDDLVVGLRDGSVLRVARGAR